MERSPACPRRGPAGRRLRAQRLPADRPGRQCHGDRQARGDGPGRLYRYRHHRRRGTRRGLEQGPRGKRARRRQALRQPGLRHHAGHRRQFGDGQLLDAIARGRGQGARDAGRGRRPPVASAGHRTAHPRRLRRTSGQPAQGQLRFAGRCGGGTAGAGKSAIEGSQGLPPDRSPGAARRRSRQDRRQCAIHPRRQPARHAGRPAPAPAAVRRHGEIVRRHGDQGDSGGGRGGPGAARRGGGRQGLLGGEARPRRAQGRVGREQGREAWFRGADGGVPQARRATRQARAQGRRRRQGGGRGDPQDRRQLRVPVPRPCADGAAGRGGQADRRQLRDLGRRPVPDRRPGQRGAHRRAEAGAGEDQYALRRRQLRPARQRLVGLYRRGGIDRQGAGRQRRAGEAAMDPRGRHPRRFLPADVLPPARSRARRRRQAGRLATSHRRPVDPGRHAVRRGDGQGRHRRHLGGRRRQPALCGARMSRSS